MGAAAAAYSSFVETYYVGFPVPFLLAKLVRLVCAPRYRFLGLIVLAGLCATAAAAEEEPQRDPEYERVIADRAEKIVAPLEIEEAEKRVRVAAMVADQYRSLSLLHARGDAIEAAIKAGDDSLQTEALVNRIEQFELHRSFVAQLAAELSPEQVDQIKDGMTYGVVPVTYQRYMQLFPDLPAEDQRQIKAWLLEAREFAMDGGSSDEKHGWFRKYKGRINNYLSAQGYDIAAAERRLQAR